ELDNRALFDKEAGELNGLLERTAAIATQIKNDAIYFFLFHFFQQTGYIRACTFAFTRAGLGAAHVKRGIEGGQVDNTEPVRNRVCVWQVNNLRFGRLVLEFNLVANEGDGLAG